MRIVMMISMFLAGIIVAPFLLNIQSSHAADDSIITSFNEDNVMEAVKTAGGTDVSAQTSGDTRYVAYTYADRKYRAFFHDCKSGCVGLEVSALFSGANIPLEAINKYNDQRVGGKAVLYSDGDFSSTRFLIAVNGVSRMHLAFEIANHVTLTDLLLGQLRGDQLISSVAGPTRSAFSSQRGAPMAGRPAMFVGTEPNIPRRIDPTSVNFIR